MTVASGKITDPPFGEGLGNFNFKPSLLWPQSVFKDAQQIAGDGHIPSSEGVSYAAQLVACLLIGGRVFHVFIRKTTPIVLLRQWLQTVVNKIPASCRCRIVSAAGIVQQI